MSSPLTRAHITAEERLRRAISQAVERVWRALPGYDERNVDDFLRLAVPVVNAGQRQSVALTEAYLARALGRRPLGVDPEQLIGPAARNGAAPEDVYRRPFVTVWTALKAGSAFTAAVSAGLARATGTAEMDVQLAARATFAAVQREDAEIRGYRRVADGGACTFCLMVDGAFVKSADAMALHNRCGCSLEPILGERVTTSRAPAGVAIHQHGELGPVLGDPSHDFTQL